MLLATRCPFCETVFRLQPAQLAQRRGLVRCGHCHEVFDASSSLFDITEGGDFATAKPVAAAAAIEALSGVRQNGPDFSAHGWNPWAPAPDAAVDNRLLHNAGNVPLTPVSTDAGVALTPRRAAEPQLPAGGFTTTLPPDDEPVLADAPLEPFAYQSETEPAVEEAPRVWHKTERPVEPAADRTARVHGIPDNEPRLGTAGFGAAGLGAASSGAVGSGAVVSSAVGSGAVGSGAVGSGAAGPGAAGSGAAGPGAAGSGAAGSGAAGPSAAGSGAAGPGAAGPGAVGSRTSGSSPTDSAMAEPGMAGVGAAGSRAAAAGAPAFGAAHAAASGSSPGDPNGPRVGGPGRAAASGEPFSVNPVNDSDPFPVMRETRPAQARRTGWAIAASVVGLLLVIALLAQLAWWQRETVQVHFPLSQALYAKACARLGCELTPPHDIDGLQVEPSDLRQIDGPHKLELKMPLHNRFNIALAYPAIELTLLDDQNNVAVRRVLWPQDYVPPGTPIAAGLPAHTTQTMIVHLDTGTAIASNFRVQIFYP